MTQEQIIAASIDYLVAHAAEQPRLETLAAHAGYEPTHFQKLFKAYVGISPKRLVQYMNMRHVRDLLRGGASTLDTAMEAGLSGTGRLHDLCVSCVGLTPGEMKSRGAGVQITYGFYHTPIGEVMVGKTAKGVCWLGFLMEESRERPIARLHAHWPMATFIHDDAAIAEEAAHLMRIWQGQGDEKSKLKLDLYGTNFQLQVWQALLRIPTGATVTYQHLAQDLGRPKASRAVGNAVGANPISVLIPCHRVIRGTGIIDNYVWGSPRKKLLLGLEFTRHCE